MDELKEHANAVQPEANAPEQNLNSKAEVDLDPRELMNRLKELESTNARLLDESKTYKNQFKEYKSKYDSIEKAKLEKQGEYQKLYEAERNKNEQLFKNIVRERIQSSVSSEASKHGCRNVDALLKLGNPEFLQYDEESGRVDGVDVFIEHAKKEHEYLFQTAKPSPVNPISPGGPLTFGKKLTANDMQNMDANQRNAFLREALAAKYKS